MEHSRLLKFITEDRLKKTMADPTFNIETDNDNPPHITEEVPNQQIIRKVDGQTVPVTGTDSNFTLSPVITVTKKETALTKGDRKLQRVTVTEDISANEMEVGIQASHEQIQEEEKKNTKEVRKSRIPLLKFRQTVERVKQEKRAQLTKEKVQRTPRRSSIPKLKDAKLVKKEFSKNETNSEPTSMEPTAMLEEEFDKIYEEIVADDPKDIDDKILAVKIEDPEKIETKFEEIIHSYDSHDDIITQPERTRLSKIPWRKKDGSKFGSLAERVKNKNSVANPTLKDGGFKISANTITTKRFSRSSSSDLSDIHKMEVVKSIDIKDDKENEVVRDSGDGTIDITIEDNITAHGIKRELSASNSNDKESNKRHHKLETSNFDNTVEIRTKRSGIPIKPERKSLSKELNKRPPSLSDRDFVNRKVIAHEELNDPSNKETPIRAEKITRSISRTFQRDGKSVTLTQKTKTVNAEDKTLNRNDENHENSKESNEIDEPENNCRKTEDNVTDIVKVATPVFTKTTHSYGIGKIQNVELSKTIEWKQAVVETKNYHKVELKNELQEADKKFAPTVLKKEVLDDTLSTQKHDDANPDTQSLHIKSTLEINKKIETSSPNKIDCHDQNNFKNSSAETKDKLPNTMVTENNNSTVENKEKSMENVTILKGNVNRLISQISVKENQVAKTEIDTEEELPKKKSVLSKIAIFEGKEPTEFSVKIKKSFKVKEPQTNTGNTNESIPQLPETTQPKLDINVSVDVVADVVSEVRNTPIIVDQIWKFEEQNIKTHEIENDATLPAAIDLTISNINSDTTDVIDEKLNEVIGDIPPRSPVVDYNEDENEDTQKESDNGNKIQETTTLPAKIDFITNTNQDNIVKYSAEKTASSVQEKQPKVGKLDLSLWEKQVEVNKQNIGVGKPDENQFDQIVTGKAILENKIKDFEIQQIEKASPKLTGHQINLESNRRLEVPIILPETPLTRRDKIDFVTQNSHYEIPIILPEKIEPTTHSNKVDSVQTVPGGNDDIQTLPGYVEFKEENSENEPNSNENKDEFAKTLPGDQQAGQVENRVTLTAVSDTAIKEEIDLQDRDVPSDPELIDSEPEAKKSNDTIMGKLKNNLFFISHTRGALNQNKNEVYTIDNDLNNNIQNEDFNRGLVNDLYSKSDIETDRNISRDEFKRAKSLAELDLGDAVIGQVQRMVYRIKSVDFDKLDAPETRKISVKEMPKKCSVLEKIALFEGKVSMESSKTEKSLKSKASSNIFQAINQSHDSEESYLQKIEDLSTAKVKYGKMDMLYLKLANDVQMPVIALGTALLDPRLTTHIVSAAIDLGYRAIDTAYIYGNERDVGQAIKSKIEDGTAKREDLYIISKLWSTYHHPELVEEACRKSLEAMGLDYFDLYLIHNPMSFKEGADPIPKIATVIQYSEFDYLDAWYVMEKLVNKGLVRSIGVSNFNSQQIQRILDKGRVKPVINQVECHPYLSQQRLQMFCSERHITLSCFGVLGSKGTPSEFKSGVPAAIDDPLVQVMASGLNVTPAQLLVRYQIQSGRNAVVKASSSSHLWDILQALTFTLEQHQIDALSALNRNKRIFTFKGMGDTHKNYPFRAPF